MDEEKMDIVEHNKDAWNVVSENNEERTNKVTESIISDAKKGKWDVVLTQNKAVPKDWFPPMQGLKILGLASGGGQQMPIFAALGADVTSFDNSSVQLAKDKKVANENNLSINVIEGDMQDLSVFSNDICQKDFIKFCIERNFRYANRLQLQVWDTDEEKII